jgi:predicted Zn-dependent peptidase
MAGELERLKTELVPAEELEKAKNQLVSSFVFGLESNMSRARRLAEYELYYGDARLLATELDNYLRVTAEDVKRTAIQYLKPEARATVVVRPAEAAPKAGKSDAKEAN